MTPLPSRPSRHEAAAPPSAPPKVPFAERLKAWWEGYEYVIPPPAEREPSRTKPKKPAAKAEPTLEPPPQAKADRALWTPERAEAAELIWGKGFIWPGGEEYFLELVKPFAINSAMSLLELSAGLGGGTRAVHTSLGIWVTGLEAFPGLAELGMERSHKAGLTKKAPIRAYDPELPELQKGKFDCVFAREAFYTVMNKENLFKAIERALKDKGQIIFTDFVVKQARIEPEPVARWRAAEPMRTSPWFVENYADLAAQLGLEMRICEDMSKKYRALIMEGWNRFMDILKAQRLEPKLMAAVVEEAELWHARIKALDSGEVQLYRFHMLKKKPGTMSDW